jgi:hypothetical protein
VKRKLSPDVFYELVEQCGVDNVDMMSTLMQLARDGLDRALFRSVWWIFVFSSSLFPQG